MEKDKLESTITNGKQNYQIRPSVACWCNLETRFTFKHIEKRTWASKDLTFHMGKLDKNNSYEHMYHIWGIIHTNMHVCNKETKPMQEPKKQ